MIRIDGRSVDNEALYGHLGGETESKVAEILQSSPKTYDYRSLNQLRFELGLRAATIDAAKALNRSGMDFMIFRKSRCNPEYWIREGDGGFLLKGGVKPADAIRDIFENGRKYGTECATAIVIVYYKALLEQLGDELFNKTFPEIRLMNWRDVDPKLRGIGIMRRVEDTLPGDRRYFVNPDVNPDTPEWQGENVIELDEDTYYGHGIGITNGAAIIRELNSNRVEDARESAYLSHKVSRPDYKALFELTEPRHRN